MKQKQTQINSVEKALLILLAFQEERTSWGVRELSVHLGFSPSTVQRLLQTLKHHNFISQDHESRQYHLGNIYFKFIDILQNTYPIIQTSIPFLKRLLIKTQETVHLNIIDENERVCIHSLESSQPLKASMPIGSKSPLYAGASSKCLLAFSTEAFQTEYLNRIDLKPVTSYTITARESLLEELSHIRDLGYAKSLGERNPGLGSLSAPIFDYRGTLLGAFSLAIPEIRFDDADHQRFCLHNLIEITRDFSKTMGFQNDVGIGETAVE
jgi:DNA-binding IclR family transcriptional regulator